MLNRGASPGVLSCRTKRDPLSNLRTESQGHAGLPVSYWILTAESQGYTPGLRYCGGPVLTITWLGRMTRSCIWNPDVAT